MIKKWISKKLNVVTSPEVKIEKIIDHSKQGYETLHDKNIIIIGGSRGIGFGIARRLLQAGGNVLIVGQNQSNLDIAVQNLQMESLELKTLQWDITRVEIYEEMMKEIKNIFPNGIDILINSAGMLSKVEFETGCSGFLEVEEKDWDRVMDTNLKAMYFISQAVAKNMISNNIKGKIINIVSTNSKRPAAVPYSISKWGVEGLTKGMARELSKYGIIVNGISPGPTATHMLQSDESRTNFYDKGHLDLRIGTSEDIANIALFLVSEYSKHIIGEIIVCDGGNLLI